jgi:putative membrane protein
MESKTSASEQAQAESTEGRHVRSAEVELSPSWIAIENLRLAYERDLIAWIQMALSLITFGFSMYKFFQYLHETNADLPERLLTPRTFGIIMITIGLIVLLLATVQNWQRRKELRSHYSDLPFSLASLLAILIATLGAMALIAAFVRQ